MSQTSEFTQPQAFGVGAVIADSFSIFLRKLPQIVLIGFIPAVIGLIASVILIGPALTFNADVDATNLAAFNWVAIALSTFIQMVIYGLTVSLLVQLAYDAKLGRPMALGTYVSTALRNSLPIVILTVVVAIVAMIAAMAFLLPGLWVYGVWSVVIPAIVIERAGFGALGRSAQLTKGYRWPIIGTIIVLGLCVALISFGVAFVVHAIIAMAGDSTGLAVVLAIILQALATGVTYGVSYISTAMIYARLREIKEGVSVDQLVSVFE